MCYFTRIIDGDISRIKERLFTNFKQSYNCSTRIGLHIDAKHRTYPTCGGHRDGRPFWARDFCVFERNGLPSQTGHQGSQVVLPAATPVCRSATGKSCCSDGNNVGHHLPFWFLFLIAFFPGALSASPLTDCLFSLIFLAGIYYINTTWYTFEAKLSNFMNSLNQSQLDVNIQCWRSSKYLCTMWTTAKSYVTEHYSYLKLSVHILHGLPPGLFPSSSPSKLFFVVLSSFIFSSLYFHFTCLLLTTSKIPSWPSFNLTFSLLRKVYGVDNKATFLNHIVCPHHSYVLCTFLGQPTRSDIPKQWVEGVNPKVWGTSTASEEKWFNFFFWHKIFPHFEPVIHFARTMCHSCWDYHFM